jgi:hypothetical protein
MRYPRPRFSLYQCLFSLILLSAVVPRASAQDATAERFDAARLAWDTGDFVRALDEFKAVLKSPEGARFFEPIALITGELFQVKDIAPDGRAVRISPDGKYGAYETGPAGAIVTRVFALDDPGKTALELKGRGFVFSPVANTTAYLRVPPNPEIDALRKDTEKLSSAASGDRQAFQSAIAKQRQVAWLEAQAAEIVLVDLAAKKERVLKTPGLLKSSLAFSSDGRDLYFVGYTGKGTANDIYAVSAGAAAAAAPPRAVTSGPWYKTNPIVVPGGKFLIYTEATTPPFIRPAPPAEPAAGAPGAKPAATPPAKPNAANPPAAGRGAGQGRETVTVAPTGGVVGGVTGGSPAKFVVFGLADGKSETITGSAPVVSSDGSAIAYITQEGTGSTLNYLKLDWGPPVVLKKSPDRIGSAAISPDGSGVVFDMLYTRNGEIFYIQSDGKGEVRLSREIQPDRAPRFLNATQVVAIKGESRHSRAYLYDLKPLTNAQIFHNPTIRTLSPEYEWVADPAGTRLIIGAERDGDTLSGKRGLYLVELTKKITLDDLLAHMDAQRSAEIALRAKGEKMFQSIRDAVRAAAESVSITKLYDYQTALFDFDSKYITLPGNKKAADYIFNQLKAFGYAPEYQEFAARGGIKTANVLARLPGTENPDVLYVLSGHFDSNQRGPGADDNSSSTAVNLETARLLARTPLPYTIVFAFFTGEEAGLLGSREFVRVAKEKGWNVAADINNDMIGWANDHHLDDTIRFTSPGLRDIQHAAAILFSRMLTYDVKYVKSTDGASFYDAYGDIVSGLGSYPVLGNPYYHLPTDLLETVNQQLMVEATKYNVAAMMMLASSPTPVKGLKAVTARGGAIAASWTPSAEKGVTGYVLEYGPESNPAAGRVTLNEAKASLPALPLKKGEKIVVAVKAVSDRGIESWEWARTTVEIR